MKAFAIYLGITATLVGAQPQFYGENGIEEETSVVQKDSPFHQSQFYTSNNFGGNSFVSSGSNSNSVIQSGNGNSIVVTRRLNANQQPEEYISVAIPAIRIDGDYFSCSTLICPPNSFKCVVTSETLAEDKKQMRTIAECFDKNNKSLDRKEYLEQNPYPEIVPPYSRIASVDRDGRITTEDSNGHNTFNANKLTKEEQEKLNRDIQEQTQRINQQIAEQQQQFQQQMNDFQAQMQQTFGKGFPFGNTNPFGNNFPFGNNNNPYGNNFPFNYGYNYPYTSNYRNSYNPHPSYSYQPNSDDVNSYNYNDY